jgi:hypothetical protein
VKAVRIFAWALSAALFLSPVIVSGILVWQARGEERIVGLAEDEASEALSLDEIEGSIETLPESFDVMKKIGEGTVVPGDIDPNAMPLPQDVFKDR